MTARWRKEPNETGLRSIFQSPRGFELREGNEVIIHVAPLSKGFDRFNVLVWYWYGMDQNTCNRPCKTKEEAKAEADAYYKKHKKDYWLREEKAKKKVELDF